MGVKAQSGGSTVAPGGMGVKGHRTGAGRAVCVERSCSAVPQSSHGYAVSEHDGPLATSRSEAPHPSEDARTCSCPPLVGKERVGARVRRRYDTPRTPLDRVLARPGIDARVATERRDSLDPFALARAIDQQLERIYALANARHSPQVASTVPNGAVAVRRRVRPRLTTKPAALRRFHPRSHLRWRDDPFFGHILKWLDRGAAAGPSSAGSPAL
jgi:hypothetical protein